MIPLPPESVRAVAAGDEVEVFVPLDVQPESCTTKYAMQYGKVPTRWRLRNKYGDGFVFAHHPLGEPGTVHGVGEEHFYDWEHDRVFYRSDADEDGSVPYLINGSGGFGGGIGNAKIAEHEWVSAETLPAQHIRHRVQTTRLGPIDRRDGVWGGVGWVRKVEG